MMKNILLQVYGPLALMMLVLGLWLYVGHRSSEATTAAEIEKLETIGTLKDTLWQTQNALNTFWLQVEQIPYAQNPTEMLASLKTARRLFTQEVTTARKKLMQQKTPDALTSHAHGTLETNFRNVEEELDTLLSQLAQATPNPIKMSLTIGNLTNLRSLIQEEMQILWQSVNLNASLRPPPSLPALFWTALLCLFCIILVVFSYRPLRGLQHMTEIETNMQPAIGTSTSTLEDKIRKKIETAHTRIETLERDLSSNMQNTTRVTQINRRIEHELALLKLYNENLVNSLRAAIIVTDLESVVQNFNVAAQHILQLKPEHSGQPLQTQPIFMALEKRQNDIVAQLHKAQQEQKILTFSALPFFYHGTETLLDLSIIPYRDESGAARGLLWVADDVTDTAILRNQLMRSERLAAVGQLSAQVAHEIRNPLSAIGLNAELLEEEFAGLVKEGTGSEALTLLKGIGAEVERLNQVTETYLQLARLPQPELQDAEINVLLNDLLSLLNAEMKQHAIEIELNLLSPAPPIAFDPGQLRQAILNIMINSREAMHNGGKICLTTRHKPEYAEIEIADNGPGIPDAVKNRIFEPFFSTKPDGTGLGLSLTQDIVQGHGGEIEVRSNQPSGTCIVVRLPLSSIRQAMAV
jgi:signal transduction histidine kinase